MKRHGALAFFISILVFCFAIVPFAQAATFPKGGTQGEFALWLVKAAGASKSLPAAPTAQDAIDFLRKLGVAPAEDWDVDKTVDEAFLRSFFGEGDDVANLDFDKLVEKLQALVESRFENISYSNPSAVATASGSGV